MKTIFKPLVKALVILIIGCNNIAAQEKSGVYSFGIDISKNIKKSFCIFVNPEWRTTNSLSTNEFLTDIGFGWKPLKHVELGAKYRLSDNYDTKNNIRHQMAFDLKTSINYYGIKLQFRGRYSNYYEIDTENNFNNPYLRYRLKVDYKIKAIKLQPCIATEIFNQIKDNELNKIRYIVGVDYAINKHNTIELGYYYQDYIKKDKGKNMFSIQYKFKF